MIDFTEVQKSVKDLKGQLAAGQIDEQTFEDRLLELIDVAEDGYYWMFGHESGQWFRHDGQQWLSDNPENILKRSQSSNPRNLDDELYHSSDLDEIPVNAVWLAVSLAILFVIGGIVYVTSQVPTS
jgi:hypothetical protein